jgi:predicted O-linked N-acetylglucosamine transferase (SPINDLY family)
MYSSDFVSNSMIDQAYERMKNFGFNMDRVSFRPAENNYISQFLNIDVMLDVYPCVGSSTTFDALYMGVPVITFYGERRNTRVGLSIFKQFGLEGLAVPIDKPQDYIERAVGMINDVETLDVLHKNLRNMMKQPLSIRTRPYVHTLEEVFIKALNEKFNA